MNFLITKTVATSKSKRTRKSDRLHIQIEQKVIIKMQYACICNDSDTYQNVTHIDECVCASRRKMARINSLVSQRRKYAAAASSTNGSMWQALFAWHYLHGGAIPSSVADDMPLQQLYFVQIVNKCRSNIFNMHRLLLVLVICAAATQCHRATFDGMQHFRYVCNECTTFERNLVGQTHFGGFSCTHTHGGLWVR